MPVKWKYYPPKQPVKKPEKEEKKASRGGSTFNLRSGLKSVRIVSGSRASSVQVCRLSYLLSEHYQ